MSRTKLHERWQANMRYIAAEANCMAIQHTRFSAVEKWLWSRPHRRIVNRSSQAYGWVAGLWSQVAHMYIRREVDEQNGTANLLQLFREMEGRPDAVEGISTQEIIEDRLVLEKWCGGSAMWANRQIAHRTHYDEMGGARFDKVFAEINKLVVKYHQLILGKAFVFEDLTLDPAWLIGFTEPWYKPRKKLRVRFD